jgi:microcystin degradation protein MlrC
MIRICSGSLENSLGGVNIPLGAAAGIKVHRRAGSKDAMGDAPDQGIDLVLTTRRGQGFAPTIFSAVGIDPEQKHILVVKSTQHFHAGFAPISKQVLYAGDLGALPGDMLTIPFERANTKRMWPFVAQPLEG